MPARVWEEDGFGAALRGQPSAVLFVWLALYFLRQGLSLAWNSSSRLEWLAREPWALLSVSLPTLGLQPEPPCPWVLGPPAQVLGLGRQALY